MIVVSDTTAITSLLKIQRIEFLWKLFGDVHIPQAVVDELLKHHNAVPSQLRVAIVKDRSAVAKLRADLDSGEAEAIVLAQEIKADVLLIDEKDGRERAEELGLRCIGLAGAMLMAKQAGLIQSLREILDQLETSANFYLAVELQEKLFRRAGE